MWNTVDHFREEASGLVPYCTIGGVARPVGWGALPGSQAAFLAATEPLVLYVGTRGCGKSECLIADFMQDVGIGLAAECKGVFIRRTFPELEDIKSVAAKMIARIHPTATYNETTSTYTFPQGETLKFRPFLDPSEFDRFLGRNVTWAAIDELASYKTLECMQLLLSILRSTHPLARPRMRCATNSWGSSRDQILEYFNLTAARAPTVGPLITGGGGPDRRVIFGSVLENWPLLKMQPGYIDALKSATKDNPSKQASWLEGVWASPPNMYFGSCDFASVTVPVFEVPTPGRIRLGFDHGITAPSVAAFCWVSKGEDIVFADNTSRCTVKGDVYVVAEYYGGIKPNVGNAFQPRQIGEALHRICEKHGWNTAILRADGNQADTSIFAPSANDYGASTAKDLEKAGCRFEKANKSRPLGAAQMLKMLMAAKPPENGVREEPALYICENAVNCLRSLPNMARDEHEPDDVSSDGDDHCYDALRFFLMRENTPALRSGRIDQLYPRRRQLVH
jgi:hypothetical protein